MSKNPLWHQTIHSHKRPLVLLHGWAFNADIFLPILKTLSKHYQITRIDLPGHGRSKIVSGTLSDWIKPILPLIPERSILLGWSLGGMLAIKIAKYIRCEHVILTAASPCFVRSKNWQYAVSKENIKQFLKTLNSDTNEALKRFIRLQIINKKYYQNALDSIFHYPAKKTALNQGANILMHCDLRKDLLQLNCPVSSILGQYDTLIDINIKDYYQQHKIKTQVLKTGHLPFLHPDFNTRILSMLK